MLRDPPTYALLLPLFERGTLFSLLHASGRALAPAAKLLLAADVLLALDHLHQRGILHRDVKSDNVLVRGNGTAVLTDFNAAEWQSQVTADIVMQSRPTGGFFKQFVVGTLPYMAPELLRSTQGAMYTPRCDIYSFGILFSEILSQTVPYADALTENVQLHTILEARYNNDALTVAITADGLRPKLPAASDEIPESLLELVCRTVRA